MQPTDLKRSRSNNPLRRLTTQIWHQRLSLSPQRDKSLENEQSYCQYDWETFSFCVVGRPQATHFSRKRSIAWYTTPDFGGGVGQQIVRVRGSVCMCLQLAHSDVHADRIQRHDHDNTREHSHGGNRCVARAMSRRRRLLQRRLCQRPCSAVGDRAGVVARIHTPRYDDQQWLKANRIKSQRAVSPSTQTTTTSNQSFSGLCQLTQCLEIMIQSFQVL